MLPSYPVCHCSLVVSMVAVALSEEQRATNKSLAVCGLVYSKTGISRESPFLKKTWTISFKKLFIEFVVCLLHANICAIMKSDNCGQVTVIQRL